MLRLRSCVLAHLLSSPLPPPLSTASSDVAALVARDPKFLCASVERTLSPIVHGLAGLGLSPPEVARLVPLTASTHSRNRSVVSKVDYYLRLFGSLDEFLRVSKAPMLLTLGKDLLQRKSEFLISELGLEPAYLAHLPVMLSYSLEGRLRPRYYVVKFLKENGLLKGNPGYKTIWDLVEKVLFMEKHICPHMEAAPHLAEDYAAACRGEAPTRFRFT